METITSSEIGLKVLKVAGPVVLDFYQAACAPPRALEPRLERVAEAHRGRVTVYRLDVERDLSPAERFGVTSVPTVWVLSGGKEIGHLDGLIQEGDLRAALDAALATGAGGHT